MASKEIEESLKTIEDRLNEQERVGKIYLSNVRQAFVLMNKLASGETMKQWSRVDPQAVLGEVYFILARNFKLLEQTFDEEEETNG